MVPVFSPTINYDALRILMRSVRRYRELLWEMTKRDLVERQAGVALPGFWVLGQPLLMMLVYVFVFSFVFNTRLGGNESRFGYTIFLLAGLVPWLSFQEAIGRAPTSIIDNAALIKQIVFPIEIIPLKLALSTVLLLAVGLLVILLLSLAAGTSHTLWWLLLPLPIFCHLTMTIGLVYFLGAAGVFIRDFRNLVQLFLMIGVFVHPILYVPGMLPRWGEFIFALSPFSYVIWLYRDVLLGSVEHPVSWAAAPARGVAFLVLGFRFFRGMSHMFGDAL